MKIYVFLITSIISFSSISQEINFESSIRNITDFIGIPSQEVYKTYQDSRGFIWFCTNSGVARYDGFQIKKITIEDGLLDDVIFNLYEDFTGKIWFLSYNSQLCYFENNRIHRYAYNHLINKYCKNEVITEKELYIDDKHSLYYSLRGVGTLKIDLQGVCTQLQENMNAIELLKFNDKYILTSLFQKQLPTPNTKFYYSFYDQFGDKHFKYIGNTVLRMRYVTNEHSFETPSYLLINNKIISQYDGSIVFKGLDVINFGFLKGRRMWISHSNRLDFGYLDETGSFKKTKTILDGNLISDVFQDNDNTLWISTLNNGVFVYNDFNIEYSTTLKSENIYSISLYNSHIVTTSDKGLEGVSLPLGSIHKSDIRKVLCGENLLVLSTSKSQTLRDFGSIVLIPFMSDIELFKSDLYCVNSRAFCYNIRTKVIDTLYDSFKDYSQMRQTHFTSIGIDGEDNIILGNINGLFRIVSKCQLEFFSENTDLRGLIVSDIFYSKSWGLIVGTKNKGVFIFKNKKVVKRYNIGNGLISNHINCIKVNASGLLILGTNQGINILNLHNGRIEIISKNQGLFNDDILSLYAYADTLIFGTRKGIYRRTLFFEQEKLMMSRRKLFLESIYTDNNELVKNNKNITLPSGKSYLRIKFRTNNFNNWFYKKYKYRLGESTEWIEINYPEILISRPTGKFKIEVCYLDEYNRWSKPETLIGIEVTTPFWYKWYFWMAALIIIVLISFLIYRRSVLKRHLGLQLENEMLSLQQRIQNARMNPHFIFNILNSIHSCLIFNENSKAEQYLLKFSDLIRDVLENSIENTLSLKDEVRILTEYIELEQLRHNNIFNFSINYDKKYDSLLVPSFLIQPFIENAILHGVAQNKIKKGNITVTIKVIDINVVQFVIIDNGENDFDIAIIANKIESQAIKITKERLENYNKMFKTNVFGIKFARLNDAQAQTIVYVSIPII